MVPVGVSCFFLLSNLGAFTIAQAQNCTPPVGGSAMVLSDDHILQKSFLDGSTATFVCQVGYTSAGGSGVVTCTAGSWSAVALTCKRRNCGNPGEVANGHIDFVDGNSLYGDKIAITCSEGYRLIGKREIACGEKGWRDHLPLCEVVRCLPPSDIANVNFSPLKEVYDFREVIQYKCEKDLTLDGSKTATCSDDEKFKPDPPICKKVECHEDNIRNAEWVAGARPPYGYFMSVTFQCKTGYGNEAKFTLICGINNRWTPEPPACEPNKVLSTTTTTRPPTVKVPSTTTITIHPPIIKTAAPAGTTPPGSGGSQWWQSWWFIILAIICSVVLIAGGCRYCGCLAFIKNKRRSRRGYSGNVATNDDEGKL